MVKHLVRWRVTAGRRWTLGITIAALPNETGGGTVSGPPERRHTDDGPACLTTPPLRRSDRNLRLAGRVTPGILVGGDLPRIPVSPPTPWPALPPSPPPGPPGNCRDRAERPAPEPGLQAEPTTARPMAAHGMALETGEAARHRPRPRVALNDPPRKLEVFPGGTVPGTRSHPFCVEGEWDTDETRVGVHRAFNAPRGVPGATDFAGSVRETVSRLLEPASSETLP